MVSRETRIILAWLGIAAAVAVVALLLNVPAVVPYGTTLVYLVVVTGLSLLGPQLSLAATASGPTMRRRHVRTGLLISGLLTLAAGSSDPGGGDPLLVVGGGLLGALLVYEGMRGYRESSLFEDASAE